MNQEILLSSVRSLIKYVDDHVPGGPTDLRKLDRDAALQRLAEIRKRTLDVALALVTKPDLYCWTDDCDGMIEPEDENGEDRQFCRQCKSNAPA